MTGAMFYKFFLFSALMLAGLVAPLSTSAYHPFYVSVTEVNYNPQSRSIEISCKMFADDFENILKQNYNTSIDLTDNKQEAQANKMVRDYLQRHFTLSVNGKAGTVQFVGFEKDSESVYCYLELPAVTSVKQLTINNSLLFDYKQEQINIVHTMVNGKRQSTKLENPAKQASFTF